MLRKKLGHSGILQPIKALVCTLARPTSPDLGVMAALSRGRMWQFHKELAHHSTHLCAGHTGETEGMAKSTAIFWPFVFWGASLQSQVAPRTPAPHVPLLLLLQKPHSTGELEIQARVPPSVA